ncbi:NAD-dependent epimerase/dehydratase family protein [Cellulomonas hominis]|uniref:NAD-dependent epimerase/dehydratase family protein n=1 Tax=Cellulomonas hominis TaxID=156981 RepID=UPI001444608F|nr:NAD-dependent epimerase/dehydratase family protein [Cellulomonas hominis]NKY09924.1 NAD-dependent epimerase/dehydratase family protein [Cellulomonas hominis]
MADCLVVGGNGFIGSHLVDELVRRGHTVAAFDRFGHRTPQFAGQGVQVISGDFLNAADVREAVHGREVVVHMLSTTDPATAENDPTFDVRTNILSSIELFRACAEAGVGRVIFASTGGAIYGDQPQRSFSETDLTLPVSPYAIGKLAIESYLRYFHRKHGLASTSVRISNPYGPRQNPVKRQGVIPIFLRRLADGLPVTIYGDGSMVRDYVYVTDVAAMVADIATGAPQHDVYNLGSGRGTSLDEIVAAIGEVTGRTVERRYEPAPPTFVDHVTLATDRYEAEFPSRPDTLLDDGIRMTWEDIVRDRDV